MNITNTESERRLREEKPPEKFEWTFLYRYFISDNNRREFRFLTAVIAASEQSVAQLLVSTKSDLCPFLRKIWKRINWTMLEILLFTFT